MHYHIPVKFWLIIDVSSCFLRANLFNYLVSLIYFLLVALYIHVVDPYQALVTYIFILQVLSSKLVILLRHGLLEEFVFVYVIIWLFDTFLKFKKGKVQAEVIH